MNRTREAKKKFYREQGFTLVELLIVVVILGILAAVVVPQFSGSSKDAKVSALKSDLSTIRGALELYALQHNDQYPDASDDGNKFRQQLTLYTNSSHQISVTVNSAYPYGPYIRHTFPKNPFIDDPNDAAAVKIDNGNQLGVYNIGGDEGWLYKPQTGEFVANQSDYSKY
ncbi:MAG: type II secretion system protein [bacterium]